MLMSESATRAISLTFQARLIRIQMKDFPTKVTHLSVIDRFLTVSYRGPCFLNEKLNVIDPKSTAFGRN